MMMMMMVSPVFHAVSRLLSAYTPLPNSVSPQKPCRTAGKRTVEKCSSIVTCSSPPKYRLALAVETGIDGRNRIQEEEEAEDVPEHVAIILDGNVRWAQKRKLPVQDGHKNGAINLKHVVSNCSNLGVKLLSVYAFSTENWNRSKMEVEFLMKVFEDFIQSLDEELLTRLDIRFCVIGNKSRLPESLQRVISSAEEMSRGNVGMQLVLALGYSGRDDVVEAAKSIAIKVEDGILRASDVDETLLEQHLMTDILEFPNPDLMIRTSGEVRISNFFLWQLAYTELYFTDTLFPDFGVVDLLHAITSYQRRHRRYGGRQNKFTSSVSCKIKNNVA